MLAELIRKEILEHLMSLRFAITAVLCLAVVLTGLFVRSLAFNQEADDYYENSVMDRQRIEMTREPWHLWDDVRVHQPPAPMKIFVRGLEERAGNTAKLSESDHPVFVTEGLMNTARRLFLHVDLVFFVGLILSLMGILFSYDAICGEKEQGTLRLMLSCSVPRDTVLIAKWIGGFAMLVVPFLFSFLSMAALVLLQPNVSLTLDQTFRCMAICGLALLFVAVIYTAGLCVSCLTSRTSTSIIMLATLWVVFILVVPNLSPRLAGLFSNTPDYNEFSRKRDEIPGQLQQAVAQKMKAWDKEHGLGDPWYTGIDWGTPQSRNVAYSRWRHEAEIQRNSFLQGLRETEKLEQVWVNQMDAQDGLARWVARISPFSSFAMAAAELAGVGPQRERDFAQSVRRYREEFGLYVYDETIKAETALMDNNGQQFEWIKIRKPVPVFSYKAAAGLKDMRTAVVDAGLLAGMVLILFMLSYLAFVRYDVR